MALHDANGKYARSHQAAPSSNAARRTNAAYSSHHAEGTRQTGYVQQGGYQPAAGAYRPAVEGQQLRTTPDISHSEELIRVRKKHQKTSRGKKVAIGVAIALVVLIAAAGLAAAAYINHVNNAMSLDDTEDTRNLRNALAPVSSDENEAFYMLLLGSDAREGDEASRSDVIILMRVDPGTGLITMVSIPRDTQVELEGYGTQKINAAYAYGGAALAVQTVSDFAGVPISHYAEIHFEELVELVDAIGGVWVDVPVSNDQTGSSNTGEKIREGYQLLDGETALAFARERYGYERGDYQRADNQKLIAQAIVKQVLALPTGELPGTISKLAGCVSTDLSVSDIADLALRFRDRGVTFYSGTVPSSTATIDGVSYVIADMEAWQEMMTRVDAGSDPAAETRVVAQASDAQAASEEAADTSSGTDAGSSSNADNNSTNGEGGGE